MAAEKKGRAGLSVLQSQGRWAPCAHSALGTPPALPLAAWAPGCAGVLYFSNSGSGLPAQRSHLEEGRLCPSEVLLSLE